MASWTMAAALALLLTACSKPSLPPLPSVDTTAFVPSIRADINEALRRAEAAPEDSERNGRLGMLLHAHDRLEASLACYRRAAIFDPKDYRWAYLSGVVYAGLSRNQEAATQFRVVLAQKPDDVPSQLRLAEALLASNDFPASLASYEKVIALRPTDAIAYFGAGQAQAATGSLERAVLRYQQACERFPAYGAAHYALGLASRQLGRPDDARLHLASYERSRNVTPPREDPLMAEVHSLSGGVLPLLAKAKAAAAAGRLQEAVDLHRQAIQLDPKQEQAYINLISLYGQLRQFAEAERQYHAAVERNPNRDEAHYNYAVLLSVQNRMPDAMAAYRRVLVLNPAHSEANNNLAFLLAQQGKFEEAMRYANKALEVRPDYPQAHYNAAMILLRRRRPEEAITHLKAAIHEGDPNASRYRQALAEAERLRAGK